MPSCSPDCCLLQAVEVRDGRPFSFCSPLTFLYVCAWFCPLPPPPPPPLCFQNFPASQSYLLLRWGECGQRPGRLPRLLPPSCCHFRAFPLNLFCPFTTLSCPTPPRRFGARDWMRTCVLSPPCLRDRGQAPPTLLAISIAAATSLPVKLRYSGVKQLVCG